MDGSLVVGRSQRRRLLRVYRKDPDPEVRRRAQIILLLANGWQWAVIAAVLFCSTRTISQWKQRYEREGLDGLSGRQQGRPVVLGWFWAKVVVEWVLTRSPRDFGFVRSRWCCKVAAIVLLDIGRVRVSRETVRRWLHEADVVWRRPRPVIGRVDPRRAAKLRKLRDLLANLPDDEVAVFQDEVDINTNPDIGSMWMRRGRQAAVVTPGNNEKRYLAGSLNWRTGDLILTDGPHRNGQLFIEHLEELRYRFRRYRRIHVICDNAGFHDSGAVREYLAGCGGRIELHWLPKYSPQANPIERIWWHLHEEITRNHRCKDINELLDLVFAWLEDRRNLVVEDQVYFKKKPAA
jgi:putative transposase